MIVSTVSLCVRGCSTLYVHGIRSDGQSALKKCGPLVSSEYCAVLSMVCFKMHLFFFFFFTASRKIAMIYHFEHTFLGMSF